MPPLPDDDPPSRATDCLVGRGDPGHVEQAVGRATPARLGGRA